ncbi:MAG: hypothetical protein WAK62_06145 [Terriglobales bacterium]
MPNLSLNRVNMSGVGESVRGSLNRRVSDGLAKHTFLFPDQLPTDDWIPALYEISPGINPYLILGG